MHEALNVLNAHTTMCTFCFPTTKHNKYNGVSIHKEEGPTDLVTSHLLDPDKGYPSAQLEPKWLWMSHTITIHAHTATHMENECTSFMTTLRKTQYWFNNKIYSENLELLHPRCSE